uniref:Uncharacterized protein n=1 Tax=Parascaris univalens TaxID=6257 RepID=A0A915B1B8_PARUN
MDEDLFGAFEDDVREGASEVGASRSNEDVMRKIERRRQEECRNNADVFLARMAAGESDVVNLKRPADSADDDVILRKKLEEDEDGIGSGIRAHPRNSIHTLVTEGNCSHEVCCFSVLSAVATDVHIFIWMVENPKSLTGFTPEVFVSKSRSTI